MVCCLAGPLVRCLLQRERVSLAGWLVGWLAGADHNTTFFRSTRGRLQGATHPPWFLLDANRDLPKKVGRVVLPRPSEGGAHQKKGCFG